MDIARVMQLATGHRRGVGEKSTRHNKTREGVGGFFFFIIIRYIRGAHAVPVLLDLIRFSRADDRLVGNGAGGQ